MNLKKQNEDIVLTQATLRDLKTLIAISRSTFSDTFGEQNSKSNLDAYLNEAYSRERLTTEINNPETSFIFAYYGKELAGYQKINVGQAQSELRENNGLEVERIYIKSAFKRLGIGRTLINDAIEQARALGKEYIWLGVWEHNPAAIAFYKKLGFVAFSDHRFNLGGDLQRDILMKKELVKKA
ncbi:MULTISPECIES: GNAT family N-acetyltransferase [Lacticaseibacillus]|uniref:GNAT family N-acetyltransferase n=3 Tax=Lacticaseibacillus TaxID=2759736 RepID=A0AAN1EXI7_LACCA|nr:MULTISPECIES: GNAT family N-acetyltransferase [Lacticaseibacillus]ARY90298.1 GNAT family N-acetyltransferase [Lacticaseibacillus casei]KAB1969959.1 GNAT family N-acetyltransferase [Lacticaseibacillus casei]MDE3281213.1 GNAT family N-acetyltransferase [Lacticaseibacillus casei]WLV78141.1 GNAT family N-acetyltransferase [Lacticaseibacillus sp. NCIMB 15471]WLV80912.1 GNAT family N-acetyltransferase [Lacticaseibacillus sp. NCIMB 15473]